MCVSLPFSLSLYLPLSRFPLQSGLVPSVSAQDLENFLPPGEVVSGKQLCIPFRGMILIINIYVARMIVIVVEMRMMMMTMMAFTNVIFNVGI